MADFGRAFRLLKKGNSKQTETKIQKINRETRSRTSAAEVAKRERVKKALRGSE